MKKDVVIDCLWVLAETLVRVFKRCLQKLVNDPSNFSAFLPCPLFLIIKGLVLNRGLFQYFVDRSKVVAVVNIKRNVVYIKFLIQHRCIFDTLDDLPELIHAFHFYFGDQQSDLESKAFVLVHQMHIFYFD